MLGILLLILKIIGIVLLVILGLVLTLLLLVLFVPIRYRIQATWKEEKKRVSVKITWLLHLLSISAVYDKTLELLVKVLGFPVFSGDKTEEEVAEELDLDDLDDLDAGEVAGEAADVAGKATDVAEKAADTVEKAADTADAPEKTADVAEKVPETAQKSSKAQKAPKEPKTQKESIPLSEKLESLKAKAVRIRDFITDPANQATFRLILRQLKALIRHILPGKVRADVVFGFDDPSVTGQVLSLCTMVYVWYGDSIEITPVFDEKVLEADVDMKGRIRPGTILVLGIRILLNKNFRVLLKRFRMNGGL